MNDKLNLMAGSFDSLAQPTIGIIFIAKSIYYPSSSGEDCLGRGFDSKFRINQHRAMAVVNFSKFLIQLRNPKNKL